MTQFDKQVQSLNEDVDKFESDLKQWERGMLQDLSENRAEVSSFNSEVSTALEQMSRSVNDKYKLTKEYQGKVKMQMDDLEHTVYQPPTHDEVDETN